MNWKELQKYPKTWDKMLDKYRGMDFEIAPDGQIFLYNNKNPFGGVFEIRSLYDFFDEQGIGVFIEFARLNNNFGDPMVYKWNIRSCRTLNETDFKKYPTRTEAEEQAFLRAFEILESELKDVK